MFVRSSSIILFVVLLLIPCASYATVTYTYTGKPFKSFAALSGDPYSSADRIYGSVTFASQPSNANDSFDNILNQALSFSFSDSLNPPITQDTQLQPDFFCGYPCPYPFRNIINFMSLSFDSEGNVTYWDVDLYPEDQTPYEISTTNLVSRQCWPSSSTTCDYAQIGPDNWYWSAYTTLPGTWTTTYVGAATVPEPGSLALFGTALGLLGLMFGLVQRRRETV